MVGARAGRHNEGLYAGRHNEGWNKQVMDPGEGTSPIQGTRQDLFKAHHLFFHPSAISFGDSSFPPGLWEKLMLCLTCVWVN